MEISEPNETTDFELRTRRKSQRNQFVGFAGFTVLELGVLIFGDLKYETWRDWIILVGALICGAMTFYSWKSWRKDWTASQEDDATGKFFAWFFGVPVVLAGAIFILPLVWEWVSEPGDVSKKRGSWIGFYYPDRSDLSRHLQSPVLHTLDECRVWIDATFRARGSQDSYDYECGYKCRREGALNICKETLR